MRADDSALMRELAQGFPFLFGGTFIEGIWELLRGCEGVNFPSFSEGLSLRGRIHHVGIICISHFPSFSEGLSLRALRRLLPHWPTKNFPSFSEGLSLRVCVCVCERGPGGGISLPFRRDFH